MAKKSIRVWGRLGVDGQRLENKQFPEDDGRGNRL